MSNKTLHARAGAAITALLDGGYTELRITTDPDDEWDGPVVRITDRADQWEVVVFDSETLVADTVTFDWAACTPDGVGEAVRRAMNASGQAGA
jgi:hypothetical protein